MYFFIKIITKELDIRFDYYLYLALAYNKYTYRR
jgi:hypothetical protein